MLGHENLGRVLTAPDDSGLTEGDLVVGIVRRPDPVPCAACAAGEWDFCRNGRYTEHGIKQLHGFARDRGGRSPTPWCGWIRCWAPGECCWNQDGITCLTGLSPQGRRLQVDMGALNRDAVLQNDAIVGSVNANRRHYQAGARALARADGEWLDRLVTRRLPLEQYADGLDRKPTDVKVVLELSGLDRPG